MNKAETSRLLALVDAYAEAKWDAAAKGVWADAITNDARTALIEALDAATGAQAEGCAVLPDGRFKCANAYGAPCFQPCAAATGAQAEPVPPSHWDEWAMHRARQLVDDMEQVNPPRYQLVARIQVALVDAMRFAAPEK